MCGAITHRCIRLIAWIIPAMQFMLAHSAIASLSASQVAVVVNADSIASRTLANHYIHLRNIPYRNVIVLSDVPASESISVEEFRERILKPLMSEIDARKLGGVIHCIAYSADFPSAIDVSEDLKKIDPLPRVITPVASINSLTYFYRWVLRKDPSYVGLESNFYATRLVEAYFQNPGGTKTEKSWKEIEGFIRENKHAEASAAAEASFKEMPAQFPLAYLAAAEASAAGDIERSVKLLGDAVAAGWDDARYLEADQRFEACKENGGFQTLLLSMASPLSNHQTSRGFHAAAFWSQNGIPGKDESLGMAYLLSTVLGVTRGPGTTLDEAIASLRRAADADYTQPIGSFYFCLTGDIRTKTREPHFAGAIAELKALGFDAEVVHGSLPQKRPLVLGACIGTPNFDWPACESRLVPGAIVDNLTSHGGVMASAGGQTKLTELIKAGAAGSSGTVVEPFAIQAKFPHPQMYVHYARGASLAEAFYLSVTGPYQLLIVGDPLCSPFANPPDIKPDAELRVMESHAKIEIPLHAGQASDSRNGTQASSIKPPQSAAAVVLAFDGAVPQAAPFQDAISVRFAGKEARGAHEARIIAVGDTALQLRREIAIPMWIGPRDVIKLTVPEKVTYAEAKTLDATVRAPGANRIRLFHDSRLLGESETEEKAFTVPLSKLGRGPVRLRAEAVFGEEVIQSLPEHAFITD